MKNRRQSICDKMVIWVLIASGGASGWTWTTGRVQACSACEEPASLEQALVARAEGHGISVAVTARGKMVRFTNEAVWTEVPLQVVTFLRGVAWGDGLFVAVGGS